MRADQDTVTRDDVLAHPSDRLSIAEDPSC
jgi:hypothetical protein